MKIENIIKIYNEGKNNEVRALDGISINFEPGKMYAIMGRSGSGKSTLINILGLLDEATSGKYMLFGNETKKINEDKKCQLRNEHIGFIFQSFYLESKLTALENVVLPTLVNKKISPKDREEKALQILEKLGLKDRASHYPRELSGGECQRVAIARALINDPEIIIADEPTGNLDAKNEKEVFSLLKEISMKGKTVIVVTHNGLIKEYCDELYLLNDGRLDVNE